MFLKTLFVLLPLQLLALSIYAAESCTVTSGKNTTALIELYTSEGCSSCPPAERFLNKLDDSNTIDGEYVPLALHVDYWDYIGWKDRFAQTQLVKRQGWLVGLNNQRTRYTPHFFVNAVEFRSWRNHIPAAVKKINSLPAKAKIILTAYPLKDNKLKVKISVKSNHSNNAALYLTVAESGLSTKVKRGENSGVTLDHNHVVRLMRGPIRLNSSQFDYEHRFEIATSWDQSKLQIAAFVQDQREGTVLQALRSHLCYPNHN